MFGKKSYLRIKNSIFEIEGITAVNMTSFDKELFEIYVHYTPDRPIIGIQFNEKEEALSAFDKISEELKPK